MQRIGLGLALGGGAARGLAHIGVLRVLERERIPVDYISGTSMGAVVAAVYASGTDPAYLARLATGLRWESLVDFRLPGLGLISGQKIEQVIRTLTKNRTFDQLKLPLAVVAADLATGDPVVFTDGSVAAAVRASIAIPGVFEPVKYRDGWLVDGGIVNNVPVAAVRNLGASIVVAVDVARDPNRGNPKGFVDVLYQAISVMGTHLNREELESANLVICPDTSAVGSTGFLKAAECIAIGEKAMEEALPRIKELLGWKDAKDGTGG